MHEDSWDYILKMPIIYTFYTLFSLEFHTQLEPGLEGPEIFAILWTLLRKCLKVLKFFYCSLNLSDVLFVFNWSIYSWNTMSISAVQLSDSVTYIYTLFYIYILWCTQLWIKV